MPIVHKRWSGYIAPEKMNNTIMIKRKGLVSQLRLQDVLHGKFVKTEVDGTKEKKRRIIYNKIIDEGCKGYITVQINSTYVNYKKE